jgi:hypothetical protein
VKKGSSSVFNVLPLSMARTRCTSSSVAASISEHNQLVNPCCTGRLPTIGLSTPPTLRTGRVNGSDHHDDGRCYENPPKRSYQTEFGSSLNKEVWMVMMRGYDLGQRIHAVLLG